MKKKQPKIDSGMRTVRVAFPSPMLSDIIEVASIAKVPLDTVIAVFMASAIMQSNRGTK